ncbi:cytochrome b561 [Pantoea anthophila]|nr:cytochrome b561 [Pantoea anthophila]
MRDKFARSQIALHWLTFLLVVTAYATIELRGFVQRGSWQGYAMIITHFSAGATILVLMIARLFLRTRHRSPPVTPAAPRWQTGVGSSDAHSDLCPVYHPADPRPVVTLSQGAGVVAVWHQHAGCAGTQF